jgi:bifunctional DNase/RNase
MTEEPAHEVAMAVESVRVHMPTGRHVLLLKEIGFGRILPIWIGPWEASAIAAHLQGIQPERPLTHDLFVSVLVATGLRLDRVVINSLSADTFHARLVLVAPDGRFEVDARPSDAIALAVRVGASIHALSDVLERAATLPDLTGEGVADDDDDEDTAPGPSRPIRRGLVSPAQAESTGEPVDMAKLSVFREFINSLDLEGDSRQGS